MIIVSAALVAGSAVTPSAAATTPDTLAGLVRAAIGQDMPGFAGYSATSLDGSASTLITLPEATDCSELETTGAASFMGSAGDEIFVFNLVAARCAPGEPAEYVALIQTTDGVVPYTGALAVGDRIKITISDDGTETTVTMKNLTDGDQLVVATASVPFHYEVGSTYLRGPLVGGKIGLTKNRVDGERLKAADPTKVIYADAVTTFKPTKIKKGQDFLVKSSPTAR